MLAEFRGKRIPLWMAADRGFATRPTLEAAVRRGELTVVTTDKGFRLLSLNELERLYGAPKPARDIYGMQWGDPDRAPPLNFIRNQYLFPLISPEKTGVEIGPGGGRWTRYLAQMKRLYAIDYHQEMLDELAKRFDRPNIVRIKNNGADFPGVGDQEIDLVFSFDVFVHLDLPIIENYLASMERIMKPGAKAFLHYSDMTKIMARRISSFSQNTPDTMRRMVSDAGYIIEQEDTTTMWHSSIIIFKSPA
jgi:phospholipid N-methyltransferase